MNVERGKLVSGALLLTLAGVMLIMPPLTLLFRIEQRLFGAPVEVIYLFLVWSALVIAAAWLAGRMPAQPPEDGAGGGG